LIDIVASLPGIRDGHVKTEGRNGEAYCADDVSKDPDFSQTFNLAARKRQQANRDCTVGSAEPNGSKIAPYNKRGFIVDWP
jgi:hypothetical protein